MEKAKSTYIYVLLHHSFSIAVTVICAIALPQLFHAFGVFAGVGDMFGQMFLPMYLPVLILAVKTNAVAGVIAGILSPVISFSISGMPTAAMLPFIIIELACFGLFAGLLSKNTMNIFVKIFTVQLLSKIVRITATVIIGCFVSNMAVTATAVLNTAIIAIPGYILQLLTVPYFINKK